MLLILSLPIKMILLKVDTLKIVLVSLRKPLRCFLRKYLVVIWLSRLIFPNTLNWDFLIRMLNQFGFHHTFLQWILTIFQFAKLSIRVNGSLVGYFPCSRGVRQGGPLFSLLFCIVDEVLNKGITNLILTKHIFLMASPKGLCFPSHDPYVDDIFWF